MFAIVTLISCTGNSSGGKGSYSAETLRENLTQKRGEVTFTNHSGDSIEIGNQGNRITLHRKPDVYLEKEIVLRVQGNESYTLREEYRDGNLTNRYVSLDTSDPVKELQDLIDKGFARIDGDVVYINAHSTDRSENSGVVYDFTFDMKGTTLLQKPNCNANLELSQSLLVNQNGEEASLNGVKSYQKTSCGTSLTSAQLKALDLSSVSFCGEDGGDHCEVKNMEFLTDDL